MQSHATHNHQIIQSMPTGEPVEGNCNCKNKTECPLEGSCLTKNIIYKAQVFTTNDNDMKEYIGMTATTFKERYRKHKSEINNKRHANDTELSKMETG